MRTGALFFSLFLLAIVACKKPGHLDLQPLSNYDLPLIVNVSLRDTLPKKALEMLKIDDVTGIKVKYLNGHSNSYFAYEADRKSIISVISNLPFSKYAVRADTRCRKVQSSDLDLYKSQVPTIEVEHTAFFWDANHKQFDVYECIKPPLKHTLLIGRDSKQILHRVEFLG